MADLEQLAILRKGVIAWNKWRKNNPLVPVDLRRADLCDAHLVAANFANVDLRGADMAGANLSRANLRGANLRQANFTGATRTKAVMPTASLSEKLPEEDAAMMNEIASFYGPKRMDALQALLKHYKYRQIVLRFWLRSVA